MPLESSCSSQHYFFSHVYIKMQGPSPCQKLKFKCVLCCCCCLIGSIKIIHNPISSGTTKWVAILCNCPFSFFFFLFFLPYCPFIWNFFADKRRTKRSLRSWNESFRSRQGWSQIKTALCQVYYLGCKPRLKNHLKHSPFAKDRCL